MTVATQISTLPALTHSLTEKAVAFDISDFGRLRVSGEDAIDLLDRLSTNDFKLLQVGSGIGTVLTTNKGRIIDLLRILQRDSDLLMITSPGTKQRVAEWIEFYTFAEDIEVEDVSGETSQFLVVGEDATGAVIRAGFDASGLDDHLSHSTGDGDSIIVRTDFGELPAYELIAPADAGGPSLDVETLGQSDLARLRVEQGVPAYPQEMNEDRNPLESLLKPHISFNKGCYIGQEVVARLNTYDRVQRFLCQLTVENGVVVDAGASVVVDDNQVGEITTSAPGLALAYLRKRFYQDGLKVEVHSGGGVAKATVRDIRPPEYND